MVMDVVFWQLFVSGMQVTDSLIVDYDLLLQRIWPLLAAAHKETVYAMLAKEASDPAWDALCRSASCWTAATAQALQTSGPIWSLIAFVVVNGGFTV